MTKPLEELVRQQLKDGAALSIRLAETEAGTISRIAEALIRALEAGGKILFCGNGGSAADSQHFAAELLGRFKRNRRGLPALALTTDASVLTSVANDYGFESVFSRQVEALGKRGDVLVGITTSGKSPNVMQAMQKARDLGMTTVALLGNARTPMDGLADLAVHVPSHETARVQECHAAVGHIVCDIVESRFADTP
jgi:D-sedoheptulose 7-phosphate isomerase